MDSEESRGGAAADASSDGEGDASDASGSSPYSSRESKPQNQRRSNPRSPESPDNYRSDNSTVDSPENFRPPSPPNPNPSSPNPSNSAPASPRLDSPPDDSSSCANKTQKDAPEKKWSPKSDSCSGQNTRSPDSVARNSPEKSRRRSRSDSSGSSRESGRRNRTSRSNDPPTEEISEGEMEFDHEEKQSRDKVNDNPKTSKREKKDAEMEHEDLSDVSDLDSTGRVSEDDGRHAARKGSARGSESANNRESSKGFKTQPKVNGEKHEDVTVSATVKPSSIVESTRLDKIPQEKTNKTDDVEEQLDFEAEEGECLDPPPTSRLNAAEKKSDSQNDKQKKDDDGSGEASSLEEGEVTDDEERRPEETEPRPVCRFYSRGQCTWGVSCRFLHPGVTDKGNYTMFDMVRSMPASGYNQHHPAHLHSQLPPAGLQHHSALSMAARSIEPPLAESAWERGLRTAKEMMRKACKRKEQDTDFEEKKMHLSLGGGAGRGASLGPGEEEDPDLAAYAGFPPPSSPVIKREKEEYLRLSDRRYEEVPRGYGPRDRGFERIPRTSKSPPHRGGLAPNLYDDKLDDRALQKSRRPRTTREVIVQRAPGGGLGSGRGDEWADPWMRGGGGGGIGGGAGGGNRSPGGRRGRDKTRRRRKGFSSGSSYSSSSSSRSSSHSSNSSARSGSLGRKRSRRRPHSPGKPRRGALSPSVIVQEKRAANVRALAMNPPAPSSRKRVPSPAAIRQNAANPPPPTTKTMIDEFGRTKPVKVRQRKMYSKSSTSGSDSSSSSSDSDSDSHSSSSTDSSKGRNKLPQRGPGGGLEKKPATKISSGTRLLSPKYIADAQKKEAAEIARKDAVNSKKRPAASPIKDTIPAKKPVSRREELLKQLKAVEEAIARKRSKV